ncbi:hypothetical protein QCA50_009137 [Cerrena zonata]|uniref:Uncharacterized protein n=1 Tax=Cerrena zonata TaxID=2478898 RepID=A0AAW0GD84_9APHY
MITAGVSGVITHGIVEDVSHSSVCRLPNIGSQRPPKVLLFSHYKNGREPPLFLFSLFIDIAVRTPPTTRDMILDKPINSPEPDSRDDDYDYDVYYFMPSCPPYIISPAYFDTIDQLAHPAFNLQAFLEDNVPTHLIAPIPSSLSRRTTSSQRLKMRVLLRATVVYSELASDTSQVTRHTGLRLSRMPFRMLFALHGESFALGLNFRS